MFLYIFFINYLWSSFSAFIKDWFVICHVIIYVIKHQSHQSEVPQVTQVHALREKISFSHLRFKMLHLTETILIMITDM